jgi:hypothetical protein
MLAAKNFVLKLVYTVMLLDMGLAPIAWQLWKR